MSPLLNIGEFARLTHLSVKALRHYDEVGLLEPASVDPGSGYRRYAAAQVPAALMIRRFRDLDMPLDDIRAVLTAPDPQRRDAAILTHLRRMESELAETQATVAALRAILEGRDGAIAVEHRTIAAMRAIAVNGNVEWDDTAAWLEDAFGRLHAVLATDDVQTGPDGALYPPEFFADHAGMLTAYVPVAGRPVIAAPVHVVNLPPARVAIAVHEGPFEDIDRTYGALGTYVAQRFVSLDEPIREHYLDDAVTSDGLIARTEVCWPIRQIPTTD